ncbi:lipoyl(octanoyl) transferase LipB [Gorillibacterium massiliense]|uniref:lipoyl(octanoyl) transferase LipB n=1 Tax=Gorillibacterium massiliense TaxID=1280390 RepID=UPI0004B201A2|nr:lipoyl(octanoyl) transferase LipB [Gorillibacterium massiliense]
MAEKQTVEGRWLGTVPYAQALELQREYVNRVRESKQSYLLFLEHTPVITMGRSAEEQHILADPVELEKRGVDLVYTDRGGDVTFHGPGQLVVYPIFDLAQWNHEISGYVRMLEETVIRSLAVLYDLESTRSDGFPGVWIGERKICAIGVKANRYIGSRGFIMSHGIALNVNTDLSYFDTIVPCGLHDKSVTSVQRETGETQVTMEPLVEQLKVQFEDIFQIRITESQEFLYGTPPYQAHA